MSSNIGVYIEAFRNGSPQWATPPLGEPWFYFRFACFAAVPNSTGMSSIFINDGGKWDWIATVVAPNNVATVLSTFQTLELLNQQETLLSYLGLTKRLCMRIRKDSGADVVFSKVF